MRTALLLLALLTAGAFGLHAVAPDMLARFLPSVHNATPAMEAAAPLNATSPWVAAVGRVEPLTEEIDLAFEYSGLVAAVLVDEGDAVRKGQVVARLKADEYQARLETALAERNAVQAEYDKVIAGARSEEKSESWLAVQSTRAIMENARLEMERRQGLLQQQLIAQEEVDRAVTDFTVARREHEQAVQRHLVTLNLSRKEDVLMAQSRLDAAHARVSEAQSAMQSTLLVSPMDGTVLRRYRHPGELVSLFFPSPVLRVADLRQMVVRAEVDETDFPKIVTGQRAFVTCDGHGATKFTGTVHRLTPMMGPKRLLTESPTERLDAKVMDVIITLDNPAGLVTGLVMDVFIQTGSSPTGEYTSKIR